MKLLLILSLLYLSSNLTQAQTDKKNELSINGAIFRSDIYRFKSLEGTGYFDDGEGFNFGVEFSSKLTNRVWINSGLNYFRTLNVYHGAFIGPVEPQIVTGNTIELIRIPLRIRMDFLKWLYIKTGLTLDTQLSSSAGANIDNQSGLGLTLSGGADLKLTESFRIKIEPGFGITSLVPFSGEEYQQHIFSKGICLILGYQF